MQIKRLLSGIRMKRERRFWRKKELKAIYREELQKQQPKITRAKARAKARRMKEAKKFYSKPFGELRPKVSASPFGYSNGISSFVWGKPKKKKVKRK